MDDKDVIAKLTETEQRSKSNTKRIDRIEARQDALEKLTQAVAVVQTKQEQIETDVGEIKTDVKTLMEKPAKRWDALIAAIFTAVVGFVIGLLAKGGI